MMNDDGGAGQAKKPPIYASTDRRGNPVTRFADAGIDMAYAHALCNVMRAWPDVGLAACRSDDYDGCRLVVRPTAASRRTALETTRAACSTLAATFDALAAQLPGDGAAAASGRRRGGPTRPRAPPVTTDSSTPSWSPASPRAPVPMTRA